jgi:hypothetical protein
MRDRKSKDRFTSQRKPNMKALHVKYNQKSGIVERIENAVPETWEEICVRFDNDVSRIKEVDDPEGYNRLYVCYDEDDHPTYYLVAEDETLHTLRRKTFLQKLGVKKD